MGSWKCEEKGRQKEMRRGEGDESRGDTMFEMREEQKVKAKKEIS